MAPENDREDCDIKLDIPRSLETCVERQKAINAVKALNLLAEEGKRRGNRNHLLFGEESLAYYANFSIRKIPYVLTGYWRDIWITLPHSPFPKTSSVCFIVGKCSDLTIKTDEDLIDYYKQQLKACGVDYITEIIPYRVLCTEYKEYHRKGQLCRTYDVFLVDESLRHSISKILGKEFFVHMKYPPRVKMVNLKYQLDKGMRTVHLWVRNGIPTYKVKFGYLGMDEDQLIENLVELGNQLNMRVPGGWPNIVNIYCKHKLLPLLVPVHISTALQADVVFPERINRLPFEPEEVTTVEHGKVLILPRGEVAIVHDDEPKVSDDEEDEDDEEEEEKNDNRTRIGMVRKIFKRKPKNDDTDVDSESESDDNDDDDDDLEGIEALHVAKRLKHEEKYNAVFTRQDKKKNKLQKLKPGIASPLADTENTPKNAFGKQKRKTLASKDVSFKVKKVKVKKESLTGDEVIKKSVGKQGKLKKSPAGKNFKQQNVPGTKKKKKLNR